METTTGRQESAAAPADGSSPGREGAPAWTAVSRGVALFLGMLALLNLAAEQHAPGTNAVLWWIDLRGCPAAASRAVLALTGLLLVLSAVRPQLPKLWRRAAMTAVLLLFGLALWNTGLYYRMLREGTIHAEVALPFSLHVAACFAVVAAWLLSPPRHSSQPGRDLLIGLMTFAVCVAGFPLAQIYCFGGTDYRRPADLIVVFGCGADFDGRLSPALEDRVRTGCRLLQEGLAGKLLLAGGPGGGDTHTADSMRELALQLEATEADLILDRSGVDVRSTVANALVVSEERDFPRLLMVSHNYQLPRIKLLCDRFGLACDTVPVSGRNRLTDAQNPVLQEIKALWISYLQPLMSHRDR